MRLAGSSVKKGLEANLPSADGGPTNPVAAAMVLDA